MDMIGEYMRSAGSVVRCQPNFISPTMRISIFCMRSLMTSPEAGLPSLVKSSLATDSTEVRAMGLCIEYWNRKLRERELMSLSVSTMKYVLGPASGSRFAKVAPSGR